MLVLLQAGQAGAEQLPKVGGAFSRFLEEASGFYRGLVMQLQGTYGDVGVKLEMPSAAAKKAAARATDQEMVRGGEFRKEEATKHRLVYLHNHHSPAQGWWLDCKGGSSWIWQLMHMLLCTRDNSFNCNSCKEAGEQRLPCHCGWVACLAGHVYPCVACSTCSPGLLGGNPGSVPAADRLQQLTQSFPVCLFM